MLSQLMKIAAGNLQHCSYVNLDHVSHLESISSCFYLLSGFENLRPFLDLCKTNSTMLTLMNWGPFHKSMSTVPWQKDCAVGLSYVCNSVYAFDNISFKKNESKRTPLWQIDMTWLCQASIDQLRSSKPVPRDWKQ